MRSTRLADDDLLTDLARRRVLPRVVALELVPARPDLRRDPGRPVSSLAPALYLPAPASPRGPPVARFEAPFVPGCFNPAGPVFGTVVSP